MTVNVYFEDVEVGQEIPGFKRRTDLMNWNRYAAVNDEFIPIHMDDEAGRKGQNEQGAFGMGNLRTAYIHNMLREWAGDEAEIREVNIQFRAINQKNDVLSTTGKIVEKTVEGDDHLVRLETNVINQDGAGTAPGYAVVALPSRG
jgi:acyl dehydratase